MTITGLYKGHNASRFGLYAYRSYRPVAFDPGRKVDLSESAHYDLVISWELVLRAHEQREDGGMTISLYIYPPFGFARLDKRLIAREVVHNFYLEDGVALATKWLDSFEC